VERREYYWAGRGEIESISETFLQMTTRSERRHLTKMALERSRKEKVPKYTSFPFVEKSLPWPRRRGEDLLIEKKGNNEKTTPCLEVSIIEKNYTAQEGRGKEK